LPDLRIEENLELSFVIQKREKGETTRKIKKSKDVENEGLADKGRKKSLKK